MLSVVVAATQQRLTTTAAVRADLSGFAGFITDDAISLLIDQVSVAIASWCGRPFGIETLQETVIQDRPSQEITLSRWPVLSVISLTRDGVIADPSTYSFDPNGFLYSTADTCGFGFPGWNAATGDFGLWLHRRAVVVYTAGYVLPDDTGSTDRTLPFDVERAAMIAIKEAVFASGRDPALRAETAAGGAQYIVNGWNPGSGLRPDVEGLVSRYRQPVVG